MAGSLFVHRIGAKLDYSVDLAAQGFIQSSASPAEAIAGSPAPAWSQAPAQSPALVTLSGDSNTATVLTVFVEVNGGQAGDLVELTCTFQTSLRAVDHEVKLWLRLED